MYGDENILNRMEALKLWTKGSAWFTGEEALKGSISKGEYADFAVLNKDYLSVPDREIRALTSNLTSVGGRIVHGDGKFKDLAPTLPKLTPDWSPVNKYGGIHPPS